MTDLVLSSRQGPAGAVMPERAPAMSLSEIERVCNMIATGGDLVPACYRNKPGAVYLTLMWARKHNVDELTAVQNIVPINGKPFVQAELHRELIEAKGYTVELIESTATRCELEILAPNGRVRRVVAALPDAIPEAGEGLVFVQPGAEFTSNALWKGPRRSDMLYSLAIRIADRRIAGSAAAAVDAGQDYTSEPDPLDVLAPTAPEPDASEPVDVTDAELVEDPPAGQETAAVADALDDSVTAGDLLSAATTAGIKSPRVALLKHAQAHLGWSGGTIDDIVADQHVAALLLDDIGQGKLA